MLGGGDTVHLTDVVGGPHVQDWRRTRTIGAVVVAPLQAGTVLVLRHEALLVLAVSDHMLRRRSGRVLNGIQNLIDSDEKRKTKQASRQYLPACYQ